ncbi:cleavage and polyadenylation specificity factor subunit 1-like [Lineus longissimus]|uniref:cleavage and polyadenylation specificity factor subunit 1-like n=1 Tax=Lineus longissimus TaxID=88925 RepID=UPI00315C9468
MYGICKQIHPPTGIEHNLYCNFYSVKEKNLVVAGACQLTVYRLNRDIEASSKKLESGVIEKVKKSKLECLGTYSLFGNIASMQTVRLAGATRDAILMSFKDAKLALVEYDPGTHDLKTSSLHFFEEEFNKGFCQHVFLPEVRVDPDYRCAVMLIYGSHLVVLPFRREGFVDEEGKVGGSKSPVLASYTIDMRNLDEKIANVIDFQFLHGYFEPTLLILYEPLRTWSGRIAVRQDTCSIVAISLNIQEKVHPVIWSLSHLPYDCLQVQAVPKPIGGVLVFASNSCLYLNQSFPPMGVSLNSLAEISTNFPLKIQEGVKISLDGVHACFLTYDKLCLSLKGGELYILTLLVDGMRSVRNFNFDKAAASVLTTCICQCCEGYLFLGSRLGNALLLKYTEKDAPPTIPDLEGSMTRKMPDGPARKKPRLDTMGEWMASDVSAIDDLDELEVYGSEEKSGTQLSSYTFEVCDSLMNIAPCGQMTMGEPAFLSEEFSHTIDPDVELVTTSGHGKNGAISVLQRSIRPQVVTTFDTGELPGCYNMWTVTGAKREVETGEVPDEEKIKEDQMHAYLILSRDDSTMILETGQEIMELDHSGFSTQAPTVFAGNVGNDKYILQVSPMGVRLLEGATQVQHVPIDLGSPIVHCTVADPYIIIMSSEGETMLLKLRIEIDGEVRLALQRPQLSQKSKMLTVCAYKDVSGLFTTEAKEEQLTVPTSEVKSAKPIDTSFSFDKSATVDDEDELLYGETDTSVFATSEEEQKPSTSEGDGTAPEKSEVIPVTYWAAVARENGLFEIYTIPDFKLVFLVKNFPMGHKVLVDSGSEGSAKSDIKIREMPAVKELLMVGMGYKNARPFLLARVNENLFLYEAFPYTHSLTDNHLKCRFKRINHGLILGERRWKKRAPEEEEENMNPSQVSMLRAFDDISGYSGVFICGPYPHIMVITMRGALRLHPMGIDGAITSFAPFHNVNCPKGFLYFNKQGELRICALPTHLSYDSPWPIRKVPLRCTPHFVVYHRESKTYAVCTSSAEIINRYVRLQGDEKEIQVIDRDDRFIYPTIEKFSVQLFSPVSWEVIPNTKIDMEDWEHVTCMANVPLVSEGTVSGVKGYMAVGTNVCYGEDVVTRGKIIIFDVIEVVPEPGQPLTKNKIKILYSKEQKGPVTALSHVNGLLISAMGQKVYIWSLKDNDLSGVAFIDAQIYIHNMISIKNMILVSDLMKSITLLQYQSDMRVLSIVSRDMKPLEVYGSEFFVDNHQLGFIVTDKDKNLLVYSYQPEARESCGGQRLLRKADFNVGSHINTLLRLRCKLSDPSSDRRASSLVEKRHVTYYATLDGAIGYLLPVSEKTYRRLQMLQGFLTTSISHVAGLNPKAFRQVKHDFRQLMNPAKNILDGDLLWKYLNLSHTDKMELSRKIGTTVDQISEDLMEVDRLSAHF